MIHVERFVNQLMSSNCYIVVDEATNHCVCIDPASEKSEREIEYIDRNELTLDYIILTHEHTDHTWGVNSLLDKYLDAKVVCSMMCKNNLQQEAQAYFRFYYDNLDYTYSVRRVDLIIEECPNGLDFSDYRIKFVSTPGHSMGSICVEIDGFLFTGDTILQAKPYINKRNGSKEKYLDSIQLIKNYYGSETVVMPGHGDSFLLGKYLY